MTTRTDLTRAGSTPHHTAAIQARARVDLYAQTHQAAVRGKEGARGGGEEIYQGAARARDTSLSLSSLSLTHTLSLYRGAVRARDTSTSLSSLSRGAVRARDTSTSLSSLTLTHSLSTGARCGRVEPAVADMDEPRSEDGRYEGTSMV
jgi:hypothetical protein